MISSYTFYKVNLDGSLSHKEQLSDTEITSFVYDIAYKNKIEIENKLLF